MAKIIIAGDSYVVTSGVKLETIKTLEKYRPKALCLYETDENGKKTEVFRVASTDGEGSISKFGAAFGSVTHDTEKLATITGIIPRGVENAVDYVADRIGVAIFLLNKVEAQCTDAVQEVEAEKAAVRETITLA